MNFEIAPLAPPIDPGDLNALAELLVDAVDSGAAVSFMSDLDTNTAGEWWQGLFARMDPRAVVLVARVDREIAGTVQLQPAWPPNQPHRAEVEKLMVHRKARGSGVAAELMGRIEDAARDRGFTLLTLDAKEGGPAEELYRKLGWVHAGTIPDYALDPDGQTFHNAVFFFKKLV